jgi:thiamine kinase-like enzyme
VWLVDFEFAVQGDPVLDLASLAAFNDFDAGSRVRLLTAYYRSSGPPFDAAHFDRVVRLQRLLAYFWSLPESSSPPVRAFADGLAAVLR